MNCLSLKDCRPPLFFFFPFSPFFPPGTRGFLYKEVPLPSGRGDLNERERVPRPVGREEGGTMDMNPGSEGRDILQCGRSK